MASRLTSLQVGGTAAVLAVGVALGVAGDQTLRGNLNYTQNGTATGVVLQVDGVTQKQILTATCAGSGGLAKYTGPCLMRSPLTTTGSLDLLSLECGSTNKTLSMSGGFVKTSASAVTAGFTNMRTVNASTGTNMLSIMTGTTLRLWNPADLIKFQTVTSYPAGGINCLIRAEIHKVNGI